MKLANSGKSVLAIPNLLVSVVIMIQIRPLADLDMNRFHEISAGYSSSFRYQIDKRESDDETIISLHLQQLESPYEKRWEPASENDVRYEKIIAEGHSVGVYDDRRLVGIAIAEKQVWNRTLWIWEFHIDKDYRGKGLGRRLMDHMASIGKETGCRVLLCETQNTNVPAIRFYRKVGFEIGAIDLSYYTNTDIADFEVAVFMKRFIE